MLIGGGRRTTDGMMASNCVRCSEQTFHFNACLALLFLKRTLFQSSLARRFNESHTESFTQPSSERGINPISLFLVRLCKVVFFLCVSESGGWGDTCADRFLESNLLRDLFFFFSFPAKFKRDSQRQSVCKPTRTSQKCA